MIAYMRRALPLLLAMFAIVAPSCPRQYGPADYDPDATDRFRAYPSDADLVYVAGASAKGDSVYVIAMPGGDVVSRIDGPDRRSWAVAGNRAYYTSTRAGSSTTLHRIDLRSGERTRLGRDDRPGMRILDDRGPVFSALALTADGTEVLVARTLADGPRAWLGWYDAATGALRRELSWAMHEEAGSVRLARFARDAFALVAFEGRDGRVTAQQLHVVDASAREIASLDTSQLPPATACSPDFVAFGADRWGTVCSWRSARYGAALMLDIGSHVSGSTTLEFVGDEIPLAWLPTDGGMSVLTDRARRLVVGPGGSVQSFPIDPQPTGASVRSIARLGEGRMVLGWVGSGDGSTSSGVALIDTATGRVLSRTKVDGIVLGLAVASERLYVLSASASQPPKVGRIDAGSLVQLGPAVPVMRQGDIEVSGISIVAPP